MADERLAIDRLMEHYEGESCSITVRIAMQAVAEECARIAERYWGTPDNAGDEIRVQFRLGEKS